MSENVGSIVYEVDANTSGLVAAQREVEVSNSKMQKGFAQTDKAAAGMQKGMDKVAKSTKPLTSGFNGVQKSSGKLSNSIRQASMQLSQVAQQGSVTGNYMQALAIQLPDLALGFGTVGIIAGALAGSLAIPLYNAIAGVDEKTKEYNKTIQDTIAGLKSVRLEGVKGAITELDKKIEEATNRNEELRESLSKPIKPTNNSGFFGDDTAIQKAAQFRQAEERKKIAKDLIVNEEALIELKKQRAKIEAEGTLTQTGDPEGERLAELYANRQEAARASIEQVRQQFQDEQTLAEEQLEERLTAIDDAEMSIAEKEQAEYEARALHAQKLADIDAKRTTDEQAEAAKRLTLKKMELAAYTQLGGQLTNLVAAAGAENTAIGKAVFLANQALAVAGIIVNTQAAAAAALAQGGPIAGPALAANVTALGYTSAAIAGGVAVGQTFSGRQTGGPTEANSTYRVNEAGGEGFQFKSGGREFIQTLGGNGRVIPANEMNQGGSAPQVNVVVNNNTASNVSVSQEQDGNNVTIQMLVADFAEGGPVSRAMASSYNTKRKTT